jgi:polysaccharide pyruvyl transferase WcaK-like protein
VAEQKPNHTKPSTILIGSYGRGNLGDDVFLVAASELFSNHKLYISSADDTLLPESAKGLVSTISTTRAGDALKKLRVFLEVNNIVYFGGDVWVELYGDRFPRRSLYKMVALNTLARLFGKKIHYVGCGIGKLGGLSLLLARASASLAHTIISRERRSAEVLGLAGIEVLPDLAVNLPYYRPRLHAMPARGKLFVIGISLLYHLPNPILNFPRLAEHIAAFVSSLPVDKFRVVLLPMLVSSSDVHDDMWASQHVQARLLDCKVQTDIYQPKSLEDMVQRLGSFDLVIGTRLHANILGAFNATPCLGIAYRAKVSSFFSDNQLGDYCIDLDSLGLLPKVFMNMYRHYDVVAQQFYDVSKYNLARSESYREFAAEYE